MANDVLRYLQRLYLQIQTAFDSIPNTGGTATVAGSNCCLISEFTTDPVQAEIPRPDKTGTLDEVMAQGGRKSATTSFALSMAGNGSPGVAPDCGPALQAGFGKLPTISTGVSVLYGLDDLLYYLTAWNFNAPSTATQMVAFNALVTKLEFELGGDVPKVSVSLEPGWVYDNQQAVDSATDPLAKGGLTTFPTEPATPVVNGTFPPGFALTATLDSNAYTTLLSAKISLEVQRSLRKDTNCIFPRLGVAGPRKVSFDFSITDDDSSQLASLKTKIMDRTPVNCDFTVGTVAGNIWDFALNNCILAKPKYGDQGVRRKMDFSGCRAYPSTFTAKDQLTLTIR